jgi:hypothetical protein
VRTSDARGAAVDDRNDILTALPFSTDQPD